MGLVRAVPLSRGLRSLGVASGAFGTAAAVSSIANQNVMPWYCDLPAFVSDRFPSCIPNAAQQVAMMQQNFGPAATQETIDRGTSDFQQYLIDTNYDANVAEKEQQDTSSNLLMWAGIAAGVVVFVTVVNGGPRRYGR